MEELQSIINKPKPFNPNKNCVAKEWHLWKQEFLNYLQLIEACSKLSEKHKTLLLINLMGKEAIIAKEKMIFENPGEEEDIEILLKKFDEIFNPPLNEIKERFKFFSRFKNANETIDDYVAIIQEQATNCNFGDQINKFIIDMIIRSMDKHVQQRTFLLKDVSLSDVIKIYKDSFINDSLMQEICSETFSNSNENNFESAKEMEALSDNILDESDKKDFGKNVQSKIENVKKLNNDENTFNDSLIFPKPGPLYKSQYDSQINQNVAGTYYNQLENCDRCKTKHMMGQCSHSDRSTVCEEFPEITCFNCNKNPHDDNCRFKTIMTLPTNNFSNTINKNSTSFNKMENCDWCETQHIRGQCPHSEKCAACEKFPHNICFQCKKNPHDDSCRFKMIITLPTKNSSNTLNKDSTSFNKIENCDWCETQHIRGQCLHNGNCTKCENFPHNICFECKKNPHDNNCNLKMILTLPMKSSSDSNQNRESKKKPAGKKSDETTKPTCWRCKTSHPYKQCPAYNKFCPHCNQIGHYEWVCRNKHLETYKCCSVCKYFNAPNQPENRCCNCRNYLSSASSNASYLQPQSEPTVHVSNQNRQQPQPQQTTGATNQRNQESQYQNRQQQHQNQQKQHQNRQHQNQQKQQQNRQQHQNHQRRSRRNEEDSPCCIS